MFWVKSWSNSENSDIFLGFGRLRSIIYNSQISFFSPFWGETKITHEPSNVWLICSIATPQKDAKFITRKFASLSDKGKRHDITTSRLEMFGSWNPIPLGQNLIFPIQMAVKKGINPTYSDAPLNIRLVYTVSKSYPIQKNDISDISH